MPAPLTRVRLSVGALTVDLDNPQWAFSENVNYLEQVELATPYGHLYRRPYGIETLDYAELRFARTDALIESLRALSHYAGRTGEKVFVVPDVENAPGDGWYVDWQMDMVFRRVIENREEVILNLSQQSPGSP